MKPTNNPVDNPTSKPVNNPYHAQQIDLQFGIEGSGALGSLKEGFEHEVDDLIKLELTAENMVSEEVDLAKAYISDDAHGVWTDLKDGLYQWELVTSEWLLRAADPTRVDWQLHHWWGDDEVHLH